MITHFNICCGNYTFFTIVKKLHINFYRQSSSLKYSYWKVQNEFNLFRNRQQTCCRKCCWPLCTIFEFSSRTLDWTFFGLPVLFFVRKCSLNNMFHWCGPLIKMLMGVPRWAKNVVVAVVVSSSFRCLMSQWAKKILNCANYI